MTLIKTKHFEPDTAKDFTYSQGCGCQITFFAEAEYATSRMLPGKHCTLHTAAHQHAARDAFVSAARAALAEYRHITQTVRQYLMVKRHGNIDLYSVIDGEHSSGFMPMRQALLAARERFGPITLSVWDCDLRNWQPELVADPEASMDKFHILSQEIRRQVEANHDLRRTILQAEQVLRHGLTDTRAWSVSIQEAIGILEAVNQGVAACEHGVKEGDFCEPCNKAYKAAQVDPENDPPEPDTCCECNELAVGFDEGSPHCAAHYRSRPAMGLPTPMPNGGYGAGRGIGGNRPTVPDEVAEHVRLTPRKPTAQCDECGEPFALYSAGETLCRKCRAAKSG